MGISGSDLALTPARSGLLRSGASRSGWPILIGTKAPLYAMSGVMRSGATRSNYHSGKVFIAIDGVHYGTGRPDESTRIPFTSLQVNDNLHEAPTTGQCQAVGFTPVEGQDLIITLGSKNTLVREFGGQIHRLRHFALTDDQNNTETDAYALSFIDYTWGMDKRTISGHYTGSVTTIAESLIAAYAPGYTARVEAGLATVTGGITYTNVFLTDALTQLCKRAGLNWLCDYFKVIRVYTTDTGDTDPTILNAVHASLKNFSHTRDLSQVVTRVQVEGGGSAAVTDVAAGETILPVTTPDWYDDAGGVVVSGPQRISYTGRSVGGGGGLVGPGAYPSSAPHLGLATGTGVETGEHDYAVTFVTAAGESLPGPVATITAGLTTPPEDAPVAGTATIGSGPDPGSHDYAVTFVTASGETTPSLVATRATGLTAAPTTAVTPGAATIGGAVDAGDHDYAVSFVTSIGETTPGPVSAIATTGAATAAPGTAPTAGTPTIGTGPDPGSHDYAVTFVTSIGETTPGPIVTRATTLTADPTSAPSVGTPTAAGSVDAGSHDYQVTFVTSIGETLPSATSAAATVIAEVTKPGAISWTPTTGGGLVDDGYYLHRVTYYTAIGETDAPGPTGGAIGVGNTAVDISLPVSGDGRVVGRRVYRTTNGGLTYKLAATIPNNTDTSYLDTTADGSLGADVPASNSTGTRTVPLTAIATGDGNVTSRKIYRRFNATGTYKLVGTIANNTTTTYSDTTANSSLGADAPSASTAYLQRIALTAIPTGDASVTSRKVYRTEAGGSQLKLLTTIANNTTTTFADTLTDASLGANVPTTNTSTFNTIPLTGIPVGDANVTSRKLYRRSGGAGLKLLATIADNTTTTYADAIANASLGAAPLSVSTAYLQRVPLTAIPLGDPVVTSRKIYRTIAGGAQLKLAHTLADNTTTSWTDTVTDASLGANVPVSNTATANQVALSAIPIGASTVTSRKVYRTAADDAQLKLLATIADNTTTTLTDATADGSLGANVPVTDTSGLPQPSGQVIPGTTALVVADTGGFQSAGGWAVIGNGEQVIRYTGITASSLTGVPATGAGAIVAAIGYNSTATDCAVLTGIPASGDGAIQYTILRGDDVNIFVTSDDLAAQATLAALIGGDGIQEYYVQDRRLAQTEAVARGVALLALKSPIEVSISYSSRDLNTRSGRTVPVNLGPPFSVTAEFLIQTVTTTYEVTQPQICPLHQVAASSSQLTFEQLLQMAKGK